MNIEFEGLDELIREIDRIEGMTENIKDTALIEGGEVLLQQMKDEVYANGLERRSGDAERSLTRTDPKNGELYVGTQGGKKAPGYYLYMHEFGFYNVRAKRFIGPRPFASIAFEMAKSKILDKQVEVIRKELGMS